MSFVIVLFSLVEVAQSFCKPGCSNDIALWTRSHVLAFVYVGGRAAFVRVRGLEPNLLNEANLFADGRRFRFGLIPVGLCQYLNWKSLIGFSIQN